MTVSSMDKPTLITVTHNDWDVYVPRLIRMVEYYTGLDDIDYWIVCDNDSDDWEQLCYYEFGLHVCKVLADENLGDLPRYNVLMEDVTTEVAVFISPDVRIFSNTWIDTFVRPFEDPTIGMVGVIGPGGNLGPDCITPETGGAWHWVPRLLTERHIPLDTARHVQTHCFAVRTEAFRRVGGFRDCGFIMARKMPPKKCLIAFEVAFSVALRAAGWLLSSACPRMHHYGGGLRAEVEMDEIDARYGWEVDF